MCLSLGHDRILLDNVHMFIMNMVTVRVQQYRCIKDAIEVTTETFEM